MKKRFLLALCVFAGFVISCGGGGGGGGGGGNDPVPDVPAQAQRKWTIIVHMAVDNNIDYDFEKSYGIVTNYVNTLEAVKLANNTSGDDINIVVLMDCYNNDVNGEGYTSTFKDGYYWLRGNSFMSDIVGSQSEINSGSVADEETFLAWAARNFPADRYMYTYFNHGGGFDDTNTAGTYGIGFDDSSNDALSHREIAQCVDYLNARTGTKLSVFYPYACLMGGAELAYELRGKADYLICSEESFPADTWSYEALGSLNTDPDITSETLAKNFCDSAYTYFNGYREFTLSVLNLDTTIVDNLYAALNTYATDTTSYIGTNSSRADVFNTIARDTFSMMTPDYEDWYYMDLGQYMASVAASASITSSTVKTDAAAVTTAMNNCVVYNRQYDYSNAHGMTIFHDIKFGAAYYSPVTYENVLTFGTNAWVDYVSSVLTYAAATPAFYDAYESDNTTSTAKSITLGAAEQSRGMHALSDEDYAKFSASAGHTYTIDAEWSNDEIYGVLVTKGNYYYAISMSSGEFDFDCSQSGTYYIYLLCGSDKGAYTLSIKQTYGKGKTLSGSGVMIPDKLSHKDLLKNLVPKKKGKSRFSDPVRTKLVKGI